jgi:glycosyltransferase involved in cell wall biosynthesis
VVLSAAEPICRPARPLKIVHCLRAPVGGLFRHVLDLARGQDAAGHEVGIVHDLRSGDTLTGERLGQVVEVCALGIHKVSMHRQIAPSDLAAAFAIRTLCKRLGVDVVHGHGAKGGAFARFAALGTPLRAIYTPHGGSLHYQRRSPGGFVFLQLEALLSRATDGLIFESEFSRRTYTEKVGAPHCAVRVIHNGVGRDEFTPVAAARDAADFLFVGELRVLKGVDVLLHALGRIRKDRNATAVVVGDGPDAQRFATLAAELGLGDAVTFAGAMPARQAFALGHALIVPSRAESFPYIVLEAVAAGRALIATNVGGIPEIFGADHSDALVPPGDAGALEAAMRAALDTPSGLITRTAALQARAREFFSMDAMVCGVTDFYAHCLERAAR